MQNVLALRDSPIIPLRRSSSASAGSEDGNFIEVYLSKIEDTSDIKSSFYGETGMHNLQRSLTGASSVLFVSAFVSEY